MAKLNSPYMIAKPRIGEEYPGCDYVIHHLKEGTFSGIVQWYPQWQCHEFLPAAYTAFNAKLLEALANFCAELTRERR